MQSGTNKRGHGTTGVGTLARLARDVHGSILPIFAFLIFVVIGVGGFAVDFGRATLAKSRLTSSADAAGLAAVAAAVELANANPDWSKGKVAKEAEETGIKFLQTNLADARDISVSKAKVKLNFVGGAWNVSVTYEAHIDTTLASVLGFRQLSLDGLSESSVKPTFPALDIAMCVDSTGSMTPTLDAVKANAMSFFTNLNAELNSRGIPSFPLVRVRMIYFKDFGDVNPGFWDPDPIRASDFFLLPGQASSFDAFVSPQTAWGGGDTTESGLECLNAAIDSTWLKVGDTPPGFTEPITDVYPLIVIWTDAPAHVVPYPNSLANPAYPPVSEMPRTMSALRTKWENPSKIDQTHKQILFFGDPEITAGEQSGWPEVKTWPGFVVGGSLTEASASMIAFLATGIANSAKGLRLTQ